LEAALKGVFNRVLKNLRKASTITDLARHQKRSRDFPDARNAAAIRVPARAPPAAYPHPLGHAGRHGAQARTAALVRAVLTRIAKQVRATLKDGPCGPALSRTPTPESLRRQVRTQVRTLIPTFDASPHARTWRRLVPPQKTAPELCRTRFVRSQVVQT
jgi:hypothetical protein